MGGYLFVYGSLRRQAIANTGLAELFTAHTRFKDNGIMQGRLYEADGYPGAVCTDNRGEKVYGEIYCLLDGELLTSLDHYEECTDAFPNPHEFIRRQTPIQRLGGNVLTAWVYLYNHDISGLRRIFSGDYFLR